KFTIGEQQSEQRARAPALEPIGVVPNRERLIPWGTGVDECRAQSSQSAHPAGRRNGSREGARIEIQIRHEPGVGGKVEQCARSDTRGPFHLRLLGKRLLDQGLEPELGSGLPDVFGALEPSFCQSVGVFTGRLNLVGRAERHSDGELLAPFPQERYRLVCGLAVSYDCAQPGVARLWLSKGRDQHAVQGEAAPLWFFERMGVAFASLAQGDEEVAVHPLLGETV